MGAGLRILAGVDPVAMRAMLTSSSSGSDVRPDPDWLRS
jgi:hypothetical protein